MNAAPTSRQINSNGARPVNENAAPLAATPPASAEKTRGLGHPEARRNLSTFTTAAHTNNPITSKTVEICRVASVPQRVSHRGDPHRPGPDADITSRATGSFATVHGTKLSVLPGSTRLARNETGTVMDFSEVIRKRRMVRNYQDRPVDEASLARIVDAGRRAPSAGFAQGQYFVVVTAAPTRRAIAELAGEAEYVAKGFDPWISRAPAHVVIAVSAADYHRRYQEADKLTPEGKEIDWPIPYWWVDAGAALMLVLLAAVDEGLAAGFLGVHAIPGLRRLLGMPAEVTPIGVVTIGHPAPDRRSGSLGRGRHPSHRVVHRERWT